MKQKPEVLQTNTETVTPKPFAKPILFATLESIAIAIIFVTLRTVHDIYFVQDTRTAHDINIVRDTRTVVIPMMTRKLNHESKWLLKTR